MPSAAHPERGPAASDSAMTRSAPPIFRVVAQWTCVVTSPRLPPSCGTELPLTCSPSLDRSGVVGHHPLASDSCDAAAPPHRENGSAFSASTLEVAVAARQEAMGQAQSVPTPAPPLVEDYSLLPGCELDCQQSWPAHQQTGPPVPLARMLNGRPRAPPILS